MNKQNIKKGFCTLSAITVCGSALIFLSGCATHDDGPEAFKHMTAQQILIEGEKALSKNNYKDAAKRFEAIDALYPFGKEVEQAQLDVIYAYYKDEVIEQALTAADRYIHLYPQGAHTDYAYYMKGIINFDRSKHLLQKWHPVKTEQRDLTYMQQAFVDFNDLVTLFPHSIYVKDAYERMRAARNFLAQHELNVAKYYFERKAYVAAANRASYVVKHFVGSAQNFEALNLMLKSYQELGAQQQVKDTLEVMQKNYPQAAVGINAK